jgi:hypothetical protein
MNFRHGSLLAAVAASLAGHAALADQSGGVVNRSSISPAITINFADSSLGRANAVRINGTLIRPTGSVSRPDEALVILSDYFAFVDDLVIQPFGSNQSFQMRMVPPLLAGNIVLPGGLMDAAEVRDLIVPIPQTYVQNDFRLRLIETVDNPGADASWRNLHIKFVDIRPVHTRLGALSPGRQALPPVTLAAGAQPRWVEFRLSTDLSVAGGTFLDIDTEGSGGNVSLALFNEGGVLVASDVSDGSGEQAQLTFGAGTRAAVGNGLPYNGRDGVLKAGIYRLAVTTAATGFRSGCDVPNSPSSAGNVVVRFNTNTGATPFCPADVNRDGTVSVSDQVLFSQDFFSGL